MALTAEQVRQSARAAAAEVAFPDPCPNRRGFESWMWGAGPPAGKRRRERTSEEYKRYQREWARAKRAGEGRPARMRRRTYA